MLRSEMEINKAAEELIDGLKSGNYERVRRPNNAPLFYGELEDMFSDAIMKMDPDCLLIRARPQ
jgi:hypothetical protein